MRPDSMDIKITPAAEKFMRRMVRFGGPEGSGFRLEVAPGGCSGLSSTFSVEPAPQEGDATVDWNGLKVFLPVQSRLLLNGVTVDFADTATTSGLTFFNPQAPAASCSSSAPAGPPATASISISAIQRKGRPA
jgi:iron-sulfur cluster assembly accessory protein